MEYLIASVFFFGLGLAIWAYANLIIKTSHLEHPEGEDWP